MPAQKRKLGSNGNPAAKQYKPASTSVPRGMPMRPGGFMGGGAPGVDELKFVDIADANYGADIVGAVTLLNGVAQGTDYNQRIGRQFLVTSCTIHGYIEAGTGNAAGRVLLVWDYAPNGVIATVTQILTASSSQSFLNLDNRGRFKILRDIHLPVSNAASGTAGAPTVLPIETYWRPKQPLVTNCSGTAATIGSIQSGALLMVTIGDEAVGPTAPNMNICTRVRYRDP